MTPGAQQCPARATGSVVAILHVDAGRHPGVRQLADLISDLSRRDDDFRRWRTDYDVLNNTHGTRRYHHPLAGDLTLDFEIFSPAGDLTLDFEIFSPAGDLTLDFEIFSPAGDQDQHLALHTAEPGSPSEQRLHQLARWAAEATSPLRQNPAARDS